MSEDFIIAEPSVFLFFLKYESLPQAGEDVSIDANPGACVVRPC